MGEPTLLNVTPTELKFRFELRKNIPVTISLHNPGSERVAFKVKTTSPKKYCVRPSSGYVEPGGAKDVQVIMQAQKEYPPSLADCKDKFLVQSVRVGPEVVEATPDLFDAGKGQDVKQVKLRVVLVGIKPPSPVPEGVEEEHMASPGRAAFRENGAAEAASAVPAAPRGISAPAAPAAAGSADDLTTVTRERNQLRESLASVEKERGDVAKRLEMLEVRNRAVYMGEVPGCCNMSVPLLADVYHAGPGVPQESRCHARRAYYLRVSAFGQDVVCAL